MIRPRILVSLSARVIGRDYIPVTLMVMFSVLLLRRRRLLTPKLLLLTLSSRCRFQRLIRLSTISFILTRRRRMIKSTFILALFGWRITFVPPLFVSARVIVKIVIMVFMRTRARRAVFQVRRSVLPYRVSDFSLLTVTVFALIMTPVVV